MNIGANSNNFSNRLANTYNSHLFKQNEAMGRISTGLRIRSAKDGASSHAISQKMLAQIRAQMQANENSQTNASMVKTAQDALSNQLDILTTIQANVIKAANDSNSDSDRAKIAEEVKQDLLQIDDIANKTSFNGKYLLNGMLDGGSAAKAGQTSSANAVTATEPKGNVSVYNIGNLKVWDGANNVYTDATGGTTSPSKLSDLVNENTGEYLFQLGDTITLTWKDNGEDKKVEYLYNDANKTLHDLEVSINAGDGANSFDTGNTKFLDANADVNGATNSDGATLNSGANPGIYLLGKSSHKITDVALSVTSSAGNTRTATQALLEPNAVQQTYGDDTKGSNIVYALNQVGGSAITGDDGDKTAWGNLKYGTDALYKTYDGTDDSSTNFTITVNGKKVSFNGGTTIEQLNEEFANNGINVRAHIANAGEVLTYDGETVTKGDIDSNVAYKADNAGLYFIGAKGEKIDSIVVGGSGTLNDLISSTTFVLNDLDSSVPQDSANSKYGFFNKELNLDDSVESSSSSSSSSANSKNAMLPQSAPVWFQIGDEANFGIQTTFGISTVKTLFGTTAESFAKKVASKEGAQEAIDTVKLAIEKNLNETTSLGALEKRFGYISDNLTSLSTNLQNASDTIIKSDPAKDVVDYSMSAVLANMSQAMLAMSNQNAFGTSNLLKTFGF